LSLASTRSVCRSLPNLPRRGSIGPAAVYPRGRG
jgi:hypothetical protein